MQRDGVVQAPGEQPEVTMASDLGPAILAALGIDAPQCFRVSVLVEAGEIPVVRVESWILQSQVPGLVAVIEQARSVGAIEVQTLEAGSRPVGGLTCG